MALTPNHAASRHVQSHPIEPHATRRHHPDRAACNHATSSHGRAPTKIVLLQYKQKMHPLQQEEEDNGDEQE